MRTVGGLDKDGGGLDKDGGGLDEDWKKVGWGPEEVRGGL